MEDTGRIVVPSGSEVPCVKCLRYLPTNDKFRTNPLRPSSTVPPTEPSKI